MTLTASQNVTILQIDNQPRERHEASRKGVWQEHFVDMPRGSLTGNAGQAVARALSYVSIPNFATLEEREALQDSALAQSDEDLPHVLAASQVNFNCARYSVEGMLDTNAKAASAALLARLLTMLDNDADLSGIFPNRNPHVPLSQHDAVWYAEPDSNGVMVPEPKVNIYREGGYFKQHTDGMQLTLMVLLNDAFEGGGTAFYAGSQDENERATPDRVARPSAGTAMIWNGDLLHMALPVFKGMRAVYVGSFDLR